MEQFALISGEYWEDDDEKEEEDSIWNKSITSMNSKNYSAPGYSSMPIPSSSGSGKNIPTTIECKFN
jgi:hypothetical protein